jgi:hypothetical protein
MFHDWRKDEIAQAHKTAAPGIRKILQAKYVLMSSSSL